MTYVHILDIPINTNHGNYVTYKVLPVVYMNYMELTETKIIWSLSKNNLVMGEKRRGCCYSGNRGENQRLEEEYKRDNIQKLKEAQREWKMEERRQSCVQERPKPCFIKTCPSASESALGAGRSGVCTLKMKVLGASFFFQIRIIRKGPGLYILQIR